MGLVFWTPLEKRFYYEWEDVAARLSLGLIYNNLSEMCYRYDLRVERDKKGDAFHHFLDHLLECAIHDEEVVTRACVVKTCRCPHCLECQGFASMFDKEHMSNIVAIANCSYFYDCVDKGIFNNFRVAYLNTEKKKKAQNK